MKVSQIDTRQGTNNTAEFSHGNVLPYTGVPFGMNYFVPQTTLEDTSWFFSPTSHQFAGIKVTHQPSPWIGDFSSFILASTTGKIDINSKSFSQIGSYRPNEATFNPHQISIYDQRYEVKTEVAPTEYGALFKYTFDRSEPKIIVHVPKKGDLLLNDHKNELDIIVRNYDCHFNNNFKLFAKIKFDVNIKSAITKHQSNPDYDLIILSFNDTEEINLHLATSFISLDQAQIALNHYNNSNFYEAKKVAEDTWQHYLDLIEVQDKNKAQISTFYHCLYRIFLFPQRCYELDENDAPIHYDLYNNEVKPGYLYMNNGFWDTSKSVYPLFSLIANREYHQMLMGFYNSFLESGYLPKWLAPDERGMMPGTLIDAVIADASVKGILNKDEMQKFLDAMIKGATVESNDNRLGRLGIADYNSYGYLPYDKYSESVNQTLDYAYSDFCISQVAKLIGDEEIASKFSKSASNYKNLFDSNSGLMRPKDSNGSYRPRFNSIRWGTDYTEGSAWQNSFAVYHDINGLQKMYGANLSFEKILKQLANHTPSFNVGGYGFQIHEMTEMAAIDFGQIAISNQPSFHLPYLFAYTDHPEYSQLLIKQLTKVFDDSINGYPGDEDNGSMSAWYIFACLGFYPVCPGTDEYVFGISQFDKIVLHLHENKKFTIITKRNNFQNQFVETRTLNGNKLQQRFIKHHQITTGGELTSNLSLLPCTNKDETKPFSLSNE